ncbi:MAG: hypothetical protein VB102_06855 [Paludibacter sp.]|nr:hypothetical protein [Paludibacter sp.]
MKNYKLILIISIIANIAISCKDPVVEAGYEAPLPPTEIKQKNLMTIEFYSRLNESSLFEGTEYQSVISHIAANTAPLAYIFDRSDATPGQKSPVVDMGWQTKTKSFFVQNTVSDSYFQGSGILVRPLVNTFEGTGIPDTLFVGGCTLSAPLGQPVVLTLMTCKLTGEYQFPVLARTLGDGLKTNKILIGTIKSGLETKLKEYLKFNMKDFRLSFYTATQTDKSYKLFFLTPIVFVNREVTELTIGSTPMYQCKIEYLY